MTTHPYLEPRLKKEYSYTSTPPWAFVICFRVNFTFTFTYSLLRRATGNDGATAADEEVNGIGMV